MFLSFFAKQVILELKCKKITVLELLRTPILCLVHLSKLRKCDATNAEKILSEWVKAVNCNFKSKDQLYKNSLFSLK